MKTSNSITFRLPTWNEEELMLINYGNVSYWLDAFELCGGVPRLVFSDTYIETIESAIHRQGLDVIRNFMNSGHGATDESTPYSLVHVNPPRNDDGSYNFTGNMIYSFASDIIYKKLMSELDESILAEAIGIFNSGASKGKYGAVSAGILFEKICLWSCPLNEKTLSMTPLEPGEAAELNITFPRILKKLPRNWASSGVLLPDKLYQPRISNLESGDAFCLLSLVDHCYHLVILQITVAETHSVKSNGLVKILRAYSNNYNITKLSLVFVTPLYSELAKIQKITNQKGNKAKGLPSGLKDLRQYKLEYML
jgi:hypothetical protein